MSGRESEYRERPQPGEWWKDRACRGMNPEIFFPERGASPRQAKEVCSGCSVRSDCLDYALANFEVSGIWGGRTADERRRVARQRNRKPLPTTVCGTDRGWKKHKLKGEEPCATCRCAHAATVTPRRGFPE